MEAPLMFTLKNKIDQNVTTKIFLNGVQWKSYSIWLNCQRYKTFPQPHQQKFIENIIFAEFFRTAYIVQYHHFIP